MKNCKVLLLFLLIVSTNIQASVLTCPTYAECKSDNADSCSVNSAYFEASPGLGDVKPGKYIYEKASISKYGSWFSASCYYRNDNATISFDMIHPFINVDKLSTNWEESDLNGMRNWECKLSPEICFFPM